MDTYSTLAAAQAAYPGAQFYADTVRGWIPCHNYATALRLSQEAGRMDPSLFHLHTA